MPPAVGAIHRPRARSRRAFSLVELLVVMTLLTFIILGLMAVFNQTQRAFKVGLAQVDVLEGGRAVMDLITREAGQMTAMTGMGSNVVNCFVAVPGGNSDLEQELPGATVVRTNVLQDFFFLRRVNQEWIGTGYTVLDSADGMGTLYRYSTNISARDLPAAIRGFNPRRGLFDLFLRALSPQPNLDQLRRVADGVVDFRIRAYGTNGFLLDPYYDRGLYTNITVEYDPVSPDQFQYEFRGGALPTAIEIELAVAEPEVVDRVEALPAAGNIRRQYLENQAGQVHVFKQRVPIREADSDAYR